MKEDPETEQLNNKQTRKSLSFFRVVAFEKIDYYN